MKNSDIETLIYNGAQEIISDGNINLSSIETIIHAGAFTPKTRSQSNMISECGGNIRLTENIFKLNFENLRQVIYLSTTDVYSGQLFCDESSDVKPISLYGHSKHYCEKIVEFYCGARKIIKNILRVGHVYGPGEEIYEKFLPIAIVNVLKDEPVILYGEGKELRSYIHVDDVVSACVNLIGNYVAPEMINVVSANAMSTADLVKLIAKITKKNINVEYVITDNEPRNLVYDNTLLHKYLLPIEIEFEVGLTEEIKHLEGTL